MLTTGEDGRDVNMYLTKMHGRLFALLCWSWNSWYNPSSIRYLLTDIYHCLFFLTSGTLSMSTMREKVSSKISEKVWDFTSISWHPGVCSDSGGGVDAVYVSSSIQQRLAWLCPSRYACINDMHAPMIRFPPDNISGVKGTRKPSTDAKKV